MLAGGAPLAQAQTEGWREVLPGADRIGAVEGRPPAAPAYAGDRLVGYIFRSSAVVASAGYGGKPVDLLIGLDAQATITGARLLEHHEPILAIGVREADLQRFIDAHRGLDLRNPGRPRRGLTGPGGAPLDAISGATVSSIVLNDALVRAARAVARSRGLLGPPPGAALDLDLFEPADWATLSADGSVVSGRVAAARPGAAEPRVLLELHLALANPPRIGRNLLGDRLYSQAMAELGPRDAIILVAANGLASFKGTSFVRSGEFDRIEVVQGGRRFRLKAAEHRRLDGLAASAGAPEFRELGLFVLPAATGFDLLLPWALAVRLPAAEPDGTESRAEIAYRLPERYVQRPAAPDEPAPPPVAAAASPRTEPEPPPGFERWIRTGVLVLSALVAALVGLIALLQRRREPG